MDFTAALKKIGSEQECHCWSGGDHKCLRGVSVGTMDDLHAIALSKNKTDHMSVEFHFGEAAFKLDPDMLPSKSSYQYTDIHREYIPGLVDLDTGKPTVYVCMWRMTRDTICVFVDTKALKNHFEELIYTMSDADFESLAVKCLPIRPEDQPYNPSYSHGLNKHVWPSLIGGLRGRNYEDTHHQRVFKLLEGSEQLGRAIGDFLCCPRISLNSKFTFISARFYKEYSFIAEKDQRQIFRRVIDSLPRVAEDPVLVVRFLDMIREHIVPDKLSTADGCWGQRFALSPIFQGEFVVPLLNWMGRELQCGDIDAVPFLFTCVKNKWYGLHPSVICRHPTVKAMNWRGWMLLQLIRTGLAGVEVDPNVVAAFVENREEFISRFDLASLVFGYTPLNILGSKSAVSEGTLRSAVRIMAAFENGRPLKKIIPTVDERMGFEFRTENSYRFPSLYAELKHLL